MINFLKTSLHIILISAVFFSFSIPVDAQTFKSNRFVTKVGEAPEDQKPKIGRSGQNAPPPPANLKQAILDEFFLDLNGFSNQELLWAWEKLWDVSHTNFSEIVKGNRAKTDVFRTQGSSEVKGCTVYFSFYQAQELFNVIFIHELGHIIQNCAGDSKALTTKHNNIYQNGSNPLTGYGTPVSYGEYGAALSCFGYPAWGENYAEMIAYYLNPTAREQTVSGGGRCINNGIVPFETGRHQDFFDLAREILGEY